MKHLIGLVQVGALTALSVALYNAHRQTHATETTHNRYPKESDRRAAPADELILLDLDGTVIAREVNLAPRGT